MPFQEPLPEEPLPGEPAAGQSQAEEPPPEEPGWTTRSPAVDTNSHPDLTEASAPTRRRRRGRILRFFGIGLFVLLILAVALLLFGRHWLRGALGDSLPQIDGSLSLSGLTAPVSVLRDGHGVPHIRAATIDDLVFAQGFVTAQDRLWQMDAIRRHAAGELSEILGPAMVPVDRAQRLLAIRDAADRAIAVLPADQLHFLECYARGVNAFMDANTDHLSIEFRLLKYKPRPWLPRDSLLVSLAMYQDLTNSFPSKLNREALTARLDPSLPPEIRTALLADLYPVGSWRDHPPSAPVPDLSQPVEEILEIPLDPSQTRLNPPPAPQYPGTAAPSPSSPGDLLAAARILGPVLCDDCRAGSNNWVVSGAHTATGSPLLSNDMHLAHAAPGIWYEADLQAPGPSGEDFHVAGVSLPGAPFIIVGHNAHVAWGFTNLGADVQDLYIEHLRGSGESAEFQSADGSWHPLLHHSETIHVRGGSDVVLDTTATAHGGFPTPIVSAIFPSESRPISLRWTVYDPTTLTSPFFTINSAADAAALVAAFSGFGGPAQNLVYADDRGHIGYHATGRVPVRGPIDTPSAISPVPADSLAPETVAADWSGYIPYDRLPEVSDPPGGILATANARITPDAYPFPITLNWSDPYRNERIWKLLAGRKQLTPADMLRIQSDVYSDPDRVIAQRLAYAIDHAQPGPNGKRLHQAADILRAWNGQVEIDSPAAAIVDATRAALWPMLLAPKLCRDPQTCPEPAATPAPRAATQPGSRSASDPRTPETPPWQLYTWGERAFAEEQLIMHTPARWLPPHYTTWDDLLSAAVEKGLLDAKAPNNLHRWRYGASHPVDIEHPVLSRSALLQRILGLPTGTGPRPQSGDGTTVKQVGRTFGPSERFTADLADLDRSTLNVVLGQSGNPASPWFMDQFSAWYNATTFALPFSEAAVRSQTTHTLTLRPRVP